MKYEVSMFRSGSRTTLLYLSSNSTSMKKLIIQASIIIASYLLIASFLTRSYALSNYTSSSLHYNSNNECLFCTEAINFVRIEVLDFNKTAADIKKIIIKICKGNSTFDYECDSYAKQLNLIIDYLHNNLTNEQICEKLKKCPHDIHSKNICVNCQELTFVVRKDMGKTKNTIPELTVLLQNICYLKPHQKCDSYINSLKKVIQWIAYGLDNAAVCEKLYLC